MIGYLRSDGDGHWYFFPVELLETFLLLREAAELDDTGSDAIWKFIDTFDKYRLSGGVESYIWEMIE